jgi:competence protein ComEC
MFLLYLLIIAYFQFIFKKNTNRFMLFLCLILVFQSVSFYEKYRTEITNQFIVFHKSRNSIVGNRIGASLKVYHNMDTLIHNQNVLKNYKVGENIKDLKYEKIPNFLQINNQVVLFIDTNGNYNIKGLQKPILVLRQSPKINLERLIKMLNPRMIIADGSNYKSYVSLWKASCLELHTSFWSTGDKGAYVLNN